MALFSQRGGRSPGLLTHLTTVGLLLLIQQHPSADACSTTVVGRKASATGAVMASHSNDGDGDEDAEKENADYA